MASRKKSKQQKEKKASALSALPGAHSPAIAKESAKTRSSKRPQTRSQRGANNTASTSDTITSQAIEITASGEQASQSDAGLCFRDAIDAFEGGVISEEEYFRHLVAHFRGLRHPYDHERGAVYQHMVTEPVASSIRRISLQDDYSYFGVEEVQMCQELMQSCAEGNMGQFTAVFDQLSSRQALLLQPVTVLAATKGNDELFRFCAPLAIEANIDIYIAVRKIVFQKPEILDFLLKLNWQDIQNSPKALNAHGILTTSLLPGEGHRLEVLRWILDHGAKIPLREYKMMAMDPPQPEVLEFLLEINPKGILKFGMLQHSAGSGNVAIVETLIKAGADVNQDPPDLGDIREPGPFRALWMAADAQGGQVEEKHVSTARILLKHGADMNLPAGKRRREETALEAAQRKGNPEMLALFEEFQ